MLSVTISSQEYSQHTRRHTHIHSHTHTQTVHFGGDTTMKTNVHKILNVFLKFSLQLDQILK